MKTIIFYEKQELRSKKCKRKMAAEVVVAYIALLAVGLRAGGEKRAEVRKTDVVSGCCCSPL
jgi:hypothetical protein